jgi:hypothetical protein
MLLLNVDKYLPVGMTVIILDCVTLNVKTARSSETSVSIYRTNIPEDLTSKCLLFFWFSHHFTDLKYLQKGRCLRDLPLNCVYVSRLSIQVTCSFG